MDGGCPPLVGHEIRYPRIRAIRMWLTDLRSEPTSLLGQDKILTPPLEKIRTDLEVIAFHRGTSLNTDKIIHRFCLFSLRCVITVRKTRKSAGACS